MARRTWKGGAANIVKVDTLTIGGTIEADDVFSITLTGEDGNTATLDTPAGSTVIATVATTVRNAFNAWTHPLKSGVTATATATAVVLTGTAGTPFYASVTTTENGGGAADAQTFTRAATTAHASAWDWNTAANWVEGVVPVAGDDATIEGSVKIVHGLRQASVALGDFTVSPTYSGTIGSLGAPLDIDPDAFLFAGSGKAYIDLNAAAISPRVTATATVSLGAGLYLTGTAIATLRVEGGTVAVAVVAGETSTVATAQLSGQGKLMIGAGVTLTNFHQVAGTGVVECAATGVVADSGTLTINGSGAIGSVTNGTGTSGASLTCNTSGTITDFHAKGGTSDFTKSRTARTVSELHLYRGGSVIVDPAVVTLTAVTIEQPLTLTAA